MSNVEYGLVMQEFERGDSGFRSFISVQSALVMYPIFHVWLGRAKAQVAAGAGRGAQAGLFRADRAGIRIESRRDDDARGEARRQYVLTGEKMWITSRERSPMSR
jgi:glutaryl-CoA dehydrogenase